MSEQTEPKKWSWRLRLHWTGSALLRSQRLTQNKNIDMTAVKFWRTNLSHYQKRLSYGGYACTSMCRPPQKFWLNLKYWYPRAPNPHYEFNANKSCAISYEYSCSRLIFSTANARMLSRTRTTSTCRSRKYSLNNKTLCSRATGQQTATVDWLHVRNATDGGKALNSLVRNRQPPNSCDVKMTSLLLSRRSTHTQTADVTKAKVALWSGAVTTVVYRCLLIWLALLASSSPAVYRCNNAQN